MVIFRKYNDDSRSDLLCDLSTHSKGLISQLVFLSRFLIQCMSKIQALEEINSPYESHKAAFHLLILYKKVQHTQLQ